MTRAIPVAADNQLASVLITFWRWRKLWIGCTVAFFLFGLLYAVLLKSDTWVATQGLIVRDEATGTVMRLGRFESQTQMKAAQEMILEIAHSPHVVGQALSSVGRPPPLFGLTKSQAPYSTSEIEEFGRNCVSVRAPRGAELGTTEVVYLEIKQNSPQRAVQLATSLCSALERQLQEVRRARADGIIQELQAALEVSQSALDESTEKLKQIELDAGADLADLRGLTDANSGSTNRLMLDMVRDELRKSEMELQLHRENLEATHAALTNPDLLMQITDRLVHTQPTIKKLREGMAEAALRRAQLQGRFADSHADVIIAKITEQRFRDNLTQELTNSARAIEGAIAMNQRKMAKLNDQEWELGKRLNRLADIRADYTNVVSEVRATNEEVQKIRRELTQALAARNAASTSSLITRINEPQLGDRPLGPGRTTIVGGSLVGGLFFGLGIVFMLAPLNGLGTSPQARLDPQAFQEDDQAVPSGRKPESGRARQKNATESEDCMDGEVAWAVEGKLSSNEPPQADSSAVQVAESTTPPKNITTSDWSRETSSLQAPGPVGIADVQVILAEALRCSDS